MADQSSIVLMSWKFRNIQNYGQLWLSHKQKCLASEKRTPDLWFFWFCPQQPTATKGSTPNWPLVVVIALVCCYRCVSPEWPRQIAHLYRSAGMRLLLDRIWSSHLLLGRPGGRFHVQSGTRPRQVSIWHWKAWCAGVSLPSLAIDRLKWRHSNPRSLCCRTC